MRKNKKILILFTIVLMMFFIFPQFLNGERLFAIAADDVDEVKDSIEDLEKELEEEEEIKERYEGDVNRIQGAVYSTLADINRTESLIENTEETIEEKEKRIKNINNKIEEEKEILGRLVQETYYNSQQPFIVTIFDSGSFTKAVTNVDYLINVKKRISQLMGEIKESKNKAEEEKNELEGKKEDHEELLSIKEVQKNNLISEKQIFEQKLEQKKLSIAEIQGKMNELKSDLARILGKSYDTGEIKDAIKFANKITGVRKGFLFGMLSMESGGNPEAGNCTYKNSGMNDRRKDYFKDICEELDYNYKKRPVSCASPSYPGSGGAMGAAQFMSDTWWGYKDRIARATGHDPPDPWSLIDGVTAMALKLEQDGASNDGKVRIINPCDRDKKIKVKWEIYASMKYLGWTCYGYTNYAPGVQSLADGYDNL